MERDALVKSGTPTGRVDYRIKGSSESLKYEMRNLEKLRYLYLNDTSGRFNNIKDKKQRADKINDLKVKADKILSEVSKIPGISQTNTNLLGMEE